MTTSAERRGQRVIAAITDGRLMRMECAVDRDHACIGVWADNADEQLGTMVSSEMAEEHIESLKDLRVWLHGYYTCDQRARGWFQALDAVLAACGKDRRAEGKS